ncbi:DUF448 domain-containing protein [Pseudokordiimonas caeni]|uniref:DUF448 domain-containing protein n=1 Tax=Pseudokordiimonas caeni TaxID=2997908 RepID=UPI002810CB09|nr:DUF448 domain-containing protein [Pseudokordiimonas caeni]
MAAAKGHSPERRCILTFNRAPASGLVRLAVAPDGSLVPDVAAKLPGRGLWVSADGPLIAEAMKKGTLARAASRSLKAGVRNDQVPADLLGRIDALLVRRCLDRLGLVQKAGGLVAGTDKIRAALGEIGRGGREPALMLAASDAAEDGRRKLKALADGVTGRSVAVVDLFDREALSRALGRDNVVHVLLFESGGTTELMADLGRLNGMRGVKPQSCEAQGNEG